MLGGFAIIYDGKRISEQAKKSSKVWRLLHYLIAHRHKSVPQEELMEAFCGDDMRGNPGSALRTMVYRARFALTKSGLPYADEYIRAKSGGYSWNSKLNCDVDSEEFEALCKKAGLEPDDERRLELLLQAAAMYKGDFLPNTAGDLWVMPLVRWYRTMYIECVHEALDLLEKTGRIAEAEELCAKALRIDPFDEVMIEHHLCSMLAQGRNTEALEQYNRMESMFYDVLGVSFSEGLRQLHRQIQKPEVISGIPLEDVLNNWVEGASFPGAYYCDLGLFKTLYQIEARAAPRSGRTAYIVRFDTKHEPKAKDGGVMKRLGMLIPGNLRMGDLFTRSAPNEYMLMLFNLTYEDSKMLINRILRALEAKHLTKVIGTQIKPVRPIM